MVSSDCEVDTLGAIIQITTEPKVPPGCVLPPSGPFLAHKKHSDSLSQYCRHAIGFSGELSLLCHIGYFSGHDANIFYP